MELIIRSANENDAEAVRRIYEPCILNTAVTFEYDVPTVDDFAERISSTLKKYPYLIAEQDGKAIGYAYAGPFHTRAAFAWAAEWSVYIDCNARRMGIGQKLYTVIEEKLKAMGIVNLYASIAYTENNDSYLTKDSIEFHKSLGFTKTAHFNKCGYKFNRWYDLVYMEKIIDDRCKVNELDRWK